MTCERSAAVAEFLRRLKFKGKGRIIQHLRAESMNREVTADCNGISFRLDLRDNLQREIYFNVYEPVEIRAALDLIPAGGVCLDVGANCGAFALPFAKKVGRGGVVHAFEPDRYAFARLVSNCRLNGFEGRLKCHPVAVSNIRGTLSFYGSDPFHSGWGSAVKFKDIAVREESVPATTLDDFLETERIHRVDFLKVDVEAHEPELLAGAANSLKNQLFRFILIEFNGFRLTQRGKSLDDYLVPLLPAGYNVMRPSITRLQSMKAGSTKQVSVLTNFLFAPERA